MNPALELPVDFDVALPELEPQADWKTLVEASQITKRKLFGYHVRRENRIGVFTAHDCVQDWGRLMAWKTNPAQHADATREMAGDICQLLKMWNPVLPPALLTTPPQGASIRKTAGGDYPARHLLLAVADCLKLKHGEFLARTDKKTSHSAKGSLRQSDYTCSLAGGCEIVIVIDDLITSGSTMRHSLDALSKKGICAFGFAWGMGRQWKR